MRGNRALYILVLSVLGPGCALVSDGVHVVHTEVGECVDQALERHRNRRWAEAAWEQVCRADPRHDYSDDYAQGFKDGFAEHLFRGGQTEPPLVAPPRYRRLRYQTPEGYQAIADWFAGFRHGAAVAQEGNYRRWVTGPSSLTHPGVSPEDPTAQGPGPEPTPEEPLSPPWKVTPAPPDKEAATGPSHQSPQEITPPPVKAVPPDVKIPRTTSETQGRAMPAAAPQPKGKILLLRAAGNTPPLTKGGEGGSIAVPAPVCCAPPPLPPLPKGGKELAAARRTASPDQRTSPEEPRPRGKILQINASPGRPTSQEEPPPRGKILQISTAPDRRTSPGDSLLMQPGITGMAASATGLGAGGPDMDMTGGR